MDAPRKLVVGVDFSESSRTAMAQAVRLAAGAGGSVHAVHAVERSFVEQVAASLGAGPDGAEEKVLAHARYAIERMVGEVSRPAGVDVTQEVVVGSAAGELVRIAKARGAELLVMGTVGQAHPARGVGTTAAKCVRHAGSDVLLVRQGQVGAFRHIVACVDFSDTAARALREAVVAARRDGATLDALHVFTPPPPAYPPADMIGLWPIPAPDYVEVSRRLRENAEQALRGEVAALGRFGEGVAVTPVVEEDTSYARGICDFAKATGADLVVIGTHGRTNLSYMLLGSTAEKVLREVECSVLAVRPAPEGAGQR